MNSYASAAGLRDHLRLALIALALLGAAIVLILEGQLVAAGLMPLLGGLLVAVERRDRRARLLAQHITSGELAEKVEVRQGEWGALSRAINGVLQERRIQQRLQAVLPHPLPDGAIEALLHGQLPIAGQSRLVTVMLVSHTTLPPSQGGPDQRSALLAWQRLAYAAHEAATRHGALLQPCGDAIMLSFGVCREQTAGASLRDALAAAAALRQHWRAEGAPLTLILTSGHALTAALPGLGLSVIGGPVEQAIQLHHLARQDRRYGLLCSAEVFHALRHADGSAWQPTDLRLYTPNRAPQVVYGHVDQAA